MVTRKLILAVAGSGKTKYLIDNLNLEERFIIVTYTNTSLDLIKNRIVKKFGYQPLNIKTQTYFEFIYSFCIKPFVLFKYELKGISWDNPPDYTMYLKKDDINKYKSSNGYLYYNRLGKFIEFENLIEDIKYRIEMFYEHFYFDEFQDLGGHDFNFVTELSKAKINSLFVGDFFQNTYTTSYDGNINTNLYSNLVDYCKKIESNNIKIDTDTLGNSYRCSPTICMFISQNLGINIGSNRTDTTEINTIENKDKALEILQDDRIIKLVYDKSNERNFLSKNWGECKGEDDYGDTCIILNKTTSNLFKKNKLMQLAPRTKNKLYVAISRTRGNCYFIDEELIK